MDSCRQLKSFELLALFLFYKVGIHPNSVCQTCQVVLDALVGGGRVCLSCLSVSVSKVG